MIFLLDFIIRNAYKMSRWNSTPLSMRYVLLELSPRDEAWTNAAVLIY